MWQTRNSQLADFDVTSLRVIWFVRTRFRLPIKAASDVEKAFPGAKVVSRK